MSNSVFSKATLSAIKLFSPGVFVENDTLTELESFPQMSVGAPCPMMLIDESSLVLAYYLDSPLDQTDENNSPQDHCAIVKFSHAYAHYFGSPNDEALAGHPLASRGLQPYTQFSVAKSSWLTKLERMNSVHPYHESARFENLKHFIFTFHDSTFECVAIDCSFSVQVGSPHSAISSIFADRTAGLQL
jgi:hypothetical protein